MENKMGSNGRQVIAVAALIGAFGTGALFLLNPFRPAEGRLTPAGMRQDGLQGDSDASVFERNARQLIRNEFLGFEVSEVRRNLGGVVVRYENGRLRAPPMVVSIQYAEHPLPRNVLRGYRSIRVAGHLGIRAELDGYSVLSWSSGRWIFTLATTSDQSPGDIHVVDVFAEQVATYADARDVIRLSIDAGVVQAAVGEVLERERRLVLESVRRH